MEVLMEDDERTRGQGRAITGFINKNWAQVTHFYSISGNPTECPQAPYDEFVYPYYTSNNSKGTTHEIVMRFQNLSYLPSG